MQGTGGLKRKLWRSLKNDKMDKIKVNYIDQRILIILLRRNRCNIQELIELTKLSRRCIHYSEKRLLDAGFITKEKKGLYVYLIPTNKGKEYLKIIAIEILILLKEENLLEIIK